LNPEEYERMYRVEDHHWWYGGMAAITRSLLDRWYLPGSGMRILDAGCGTGAAMTSYLAAYGRVTGFDLSGIALTFCRRRQADRLARASVTDLPFASRSFELVTSFEVLYEQGVRDDGAAVAEFLRVLVPGGRLFLRLPAYDWLRGRHDLAVHTARRYTRRRVADLLERNGFRLERLSYANMLLFPLAVIKRMIERILPRRDRSASDLTLGLGPFNGLLRAALAAEAPWIRRRGLPFGLSVVAVGRKP
jgi:SAM-dependent methyltransferase